MALTEALQMLATTAATGLIGAVTKDAWSTARTQALRVWSGGTARQQQVTESRLEATRAALANATDDEREQVVQREAAVWCTRFSDLLEESPEAAPALRDLVRSLTELGVLSTDSTVFHDRVVNVATSGGVAAAVIHGSVSTANPSPPGSAPR